MHNCENGKHLGKESRHGELISREINLTLSFVYEWDLVKGIKTERKIMRLRRQRIPIRIYNTQKVYVIFILSRIGENEWLIHRKFETLTNFTTFYYTILSIYFSEFIAI